LEEGILSAVSHRDQLAHCWEALSQGDPNPFLELYDPEIELFIPKWVNPDSGVFRGADAVNRWYGDFFAQWADQQWKLVETHELAESVVFAVEWSGRGKRSGVVFGGRALGVMSFQDGRIVSIVHLGGLYREGAPD
jgi:ketosteroid isomerase-like protein